MILTCPDCHTSYTVAGSALGGAAGRQVRCTKCGKVWHYQPDIPAVREDRPEARAVREPVGEIAVAAANKTPEPIVASPPPQPAPTRATIEELRPEPTFATPPASVGPPSPPPSLREPLLDADPRQAERPAASRRRRFRIVGLTLASLMLGLVLIAIWARDPIMRAWPSAVPLYQSVRLADPAGAGLLVTVDPARTADSLVVNGKITNTAATRRDIPRLRVALRDGSNTEVASQVIDPPRASLAPGATTGFSAVFKNPDSTATGVAVTFATR